MAHLSARGTGMDRQRVADGRSRSPGERRAGRRLIGLGGVFRSVHKLNRSARLAQEAEGASGRVS
jgi:hypothetical protein